MEGSYYYLLSWWYYSWIWALQFDRRSCDRSGPIYCNSSRRVIFISAPWTKSLPSARLSLDQIIIGTILRLCDDVKVSLVYLYRHRARHFQRLFAASLFCLFGILPFWKNQSLSFVLFVMILWWYWMHIVSLFYPNSNPELVLVWTSPFVESYGILCRIPVNLPWYAIYQLTCPG